jgi:hypothetical protein
MGNDERVAKLDALTARLEAARRPIDEAGAKLASAMAQCGATVRQIATAGAYLSKIELSAEAREALKDWKDRDKFWATARYDLGITDEEFQSLTPRQFIALHARMLECERRRAGMLAEAALTAKGKTRVKPIRPKRQEWIGTERSLANHIGEQWKQGKMEGTSERDAITRNASQYVIKLPNGKLKTINPQSLWRNHYQENR